MDLTLRLIKAKQALATELNKLLAEFDLSTRGYWVLSTAEPGVHTQRELSERCEIDKTTMVATIDDLEDQGLLKRTRSASDRRAWIISLTDKGVEVLARARPIVGAVEGRALEAIPPDERAAFLSGLAKLAGAGVAQLEKSSGN